MRPPLTSVAIFLIVAALFLYCSVAHSESLTTQNLVPGMSDLTTSGGTSFGTGAGCDEGAFCTAGTNQEGGTYSSTFDVPLTEAEIQQGFTLNSGVTISSHESNTQLETCGDVLQSGDCRDIFRLTISLFDAGVTVEQFIHREEMDFEGLRAFTFVDTVAVNDYGVLTGLFELFGIDAGFPSGFYGPQFSDPALTIGYQTVLIQEQVVAEVQAIIEAQVEAEIVQVAAVETPVALPEVTATTLPTFSEPTTTETAAAPPAATVAPIDVTPTLPTLPTFSSPPALPTFSPPPVAETATATADLAPPTASVEPVIAPIAPPPTETQQVQNTQAEAQIAEVQAQSQPEPAPEMQAQPEAQAEPEVQAEAQPEPEAQAEAQAEPETQAEPEAQAEAAPTTEPEAEPEPETETQEAEPTDTPAPVAKETPKAVAKAAPKAKAKRMTPAVAAQTVVDNIAPSQRYGDSAQVVTLVAMTLIGETAALLKQPTSLTDITAYTDAKLADGPSMIDRLTNYRMFGQANGVHAALIESQWKQ
tara:strand:- start:4224 stop:5816 length:1593 start_codon:yes stop_codon:yes gene_type:complete